MKNKIVKKAILHLEKSIFEIEKDIENSIKLISRYKKTIEVYKSKIGLDYKIDMVLIAINECEMEDGLGEALIVGQQYQFLEVKKDAGGMNIVIKSEIHSVHLFPFSDVLNYFKIKKNENK